MFGFLRRAATAALLGLSSFAALAVQITGLPVYVDKSIWTVDFFVLNDGAVPSVDQFTVYFDSADFDDLTLVGSPATWDTLAVAPDRGLQGAGFLDAIALTPEAALLPGQSIGAFRIQARLFSQAFPRSLAFEIYSEDFQLLETGSVQMVPEVPAWALLGVGLAALCGIQRRNRWTFSGQKLA